MKNFKYLGTKFYKDTHIYLIMNYEFIMPIREKKKYYDTQRCTFERTIRKHHKELIGEWKDLFSLFWIDFVPGAGMSIDKYLYCDKKLFGRKLKRGFV